MSNIQNMYQLILEINKLKLVLRNTTTSHDRKESTAEYPYFTFSKTFSALYEKLKASLLEEKLITNNK